MGALAFAEPVGLVSGSWDKTVRTWPTDGKGAVPLPESPSCPNFNETKYLGSVFHETFTRSCRLFGSYVTDHDWIW